MSFWLVGFSCLKGILSGFLIWLLHVPLKNAYLGLAISNLKSTHKDHPPQAAQTFNYSRPQIILNTFWLVLLVVSFTCPLGFLSFPFLSLSFQFPFLSFHCPFLSFPFLFKSRFSRIFFWKSHYLGPTLDQGGGGLLIRGPHYTIYNLSAQFLGNGDVYGHGGHKLYILNHGCNAHFEPLWPQCSLSKIYRTYFCLIISSRNFG